jgi:hypothetical protein
LDFFELVPALSLCVLASDQTGLAAFALLRRRLLLLRLRLLLLYWRLLLFVLLRMLRARSRQQHWLSDVTRLLQPG